VYLLFWKSICEDVRLWRIMYNNYFGGPPDMGGYRISLMINFVSLREIANVNDKLVWAILHGHYNTLRVLLSATDANVNHYDSILKSSCLYLASSTSNVDVVKELLISGARVDDCGNMISERPLHIACKLGHVSIVTLLLTHKANVNALDKYGRSALHKAAYEGCTEVVQLLLQTPGINVELEEICYGQTALHIACARNHVDIACLLLRSNSNINAVDWDGWTPLHLACFKGNKAVVTALLSHDAAALVDEDRSWGRETSLTYKLHSGRSLGRERGLATLEVMT